MQRYAYYSAFTIALHNELSENHGLSGSLVTYKLKIKEYKNLKEDDEFLIDLQKSFELRDRKIWLSKMQLKSIRNYVSIRMATFYTPIK